MADGSPTSGGSGDVLVTEDTYNDTLTGTSGQKVAVGKLYGGAKGVSTGPVVPITNDLPTGDFKSQALLGTLVELMTDALEALRSIFGSITTGLQAAVQASQTSKSVVIGVATSAVLLNPNGSRIGAAFYNDSTSSGNLFLLLAGPGQKATTAAGGCTVRIPPGGYYELPANAVHLGWVYGIWDSVTTPGWVNITEFSS